MVRPLLCLLLLLAGCATPAGSERRPAMAPAAGAAVLYIVPFLAITAPVEIAEGIFATFVASLDEQGAARGYRFVVLADGGERAWLRRQPYVTGEIFGYPTDAGAGSTAMRIDSAIRLFQPGRDQAVLHIDYPLTVFSEDGLERRRRAAEIGNHLAAGLLQTIASP